MVTSRAREIRGPQEILRKTVKSNKFTVPLDGSKDEIEKRKPALWRESKTFFRQDRASCRRRDFTRSVSDHSVNRPPEGDARKDVPDGIDFRHSTVGSLKGLDKTDVKASSGNQCKKTNFFYRRDISIDTRTNFDAPTYARVKHPSDGRVRKPITVANHTRARSREHCRGVVVGGGGRHEIQSSRHVPCKTRRFIFYDGRKPLAGILK